MKTIMVLAVCVWLLSYSGNERRKATTDALVTAGGWGELNGERVWYPVGEA